MIVAAWGASEGADIGGDGGERAGNPVGFDADVHAAVVIEVDEQSAADTVTNGGECERDRCGHRGVVEDTRVGRAGQVPEVRIAGLALERGGGVAGSRLDEDVEAVEADEDAEDLGASSACGVGAVGKHVAEPGEPEQTVGSSVVPELALELGERAARCGQGNTPSGASPAALAASTSLKGANEGDSAEAADAGADVKDADVVVVPSSGGVVCRRRLRAKRSGHGRRHRGAFVPGDLGMVGTPVVGAFGALRRSRVRGAVWVWTVGAVELGAAGSGWMMPRWAPLVVGAVTGVGTGGFDDGVPGAVVAGLGWAASGMTRFQPG